MLVFVTGCPIPPPVTPCTEDADCDDGLFCNGVETCVEEVCVAGEAPCEADYCDEENGVCLECLTDADCDDADLCTTDACVANACVYTAVDCVDQVCDPVTGDCVDCVADADCDDGLFCTGVETCVDNACVAGTDPCDPDTEVCDEVAGACVEICETDADCDDGLYCNGPETCGDDGACVDGTSPCVEGELCDEDADACVDCLTDADCEADEVCVAGACTPSCVACVADEDCDDTIACTDDTCSDLCCAHVDNCATGTFCDMVEGAGTCVGCLTNDDCPEATPICTSGGTCVECEADTDCTVGSCVDNVCITTIVFTIGQDNLFGTTGDDTFDGSLDVITQTGAQVATVQTGDSADGKDGVDTLNASFNASAATNVVPTLTNIEILNVSDYGSAASTLKLGSTTNATAVNAVGSVLTTLVEDIGTAIDLGITNTDQGFTATFKQAATAGTADSSTLTLDRVTGGTMTIVTNAASGLETLTLSSTGANANTLDALATTGNAATLKTLYVTGDQAVKVKVVPTSLTTRIDASGMTVESPSAGLTLGTGTSVTGASAYTTFGTFAIGNLAGSPGDDEFIFAATLDSSDADGTTEWLDGGAGTDVLQCSLAASLSTAAHIKNIEELRINATAAATMALTSVTGLETLTIESDAAVTGSQDALILSNFPDIPTLAYRGNGAEGSQFFDTVTYSTLGGSGGSDTLAVTVGNRGTALGTSGSSNAFNVGALTAANIETITYTITDMPTSAATPTTLGGITALGMNSLTVISNGDVILGTVVGETILLATVNLSGVSGRIRATSTIQQMATGGTVTLTANNDNIIVTPGAAQTGVTVNCGAGDDTILHTASGASTVTINGEAGDDTMTTDGTTGDTMTGGTGNDTMTGVGGDDTITGGAGNDTIVGGAGANTLTGGSGNDTITGGAGIDTIVGTSGTNTINGAGAVDVITCGTGIDTLQFDANNATAADADSISSFTVGASGDVLALDVSGVAGGIASALADGAPVAIASSADNSFIVDSAGTGYATFLLAEAAVNAVTVGTDDYALMFFNTTNSRVEVHLDAISSTAGSNILIAYFTDINTDTLADVFLAAFVQANWDAY